MGGRQGAELGAVARGENVKYGARDLVTKYVGLSSPHAQREAELFFMVSWRPPSHSPSRATTTALHTPPLRTTRHHPPTPSANIGRKLTVTKAPLHHLTSGVPTAEIYRIFSSHFFLLSQVSLPSLNCWLGQTTAMPRREEVGITVRSFEVIRTPCSNTPGVNPPPALCPPWRRS